MLHHLWHSSGELVTLTTLFSDFVSDEQKSKLTFGHEKRKEF